MNCTKNFGTLFYFELKKIFHKKLVWVTLGVMLTVTVFSVCSPFLGEYVINGESKGSNYRQLATDKAWQKELNGRAVNQELLEEAYAGYGRVPGDTTDIPYSATEEYQKYARPYSAIFLLSSRMMQMTTEEAFAWQPKEQELYRLWRENVRKEGDYHYLTKGEAAYWEEKTAQIETPFIYRYNEGYYSLLRTLLTMGFITLTSVSICLADIFPGEHIRRMQQLNLSGKNGRRLYRAKMLAGGLVAAGSGLLYSMTAVSLSLALYGAEGFQSAFQLIHPQCGYPMSSGEAVLIAYGILIAAALFWGIFVMVLSEVFRNNIAALGIASGMILLSMFLNIPEQYRLLSQLWGYFPGAEMLSYWGTFEPRLVPFFGGYLTKWQFAPVLYLLVGTLLALIGKLVYGKGNDK